MLFVGCVLSGLGIGMLFDHVIAGLLIGVGAAFAIAECSAVSSRSCVPTRRRDKV